MQRNAVQDQRHAITSRRSRAGPGRRRTPSIA